MSSPPQTPTHRPTSSHRRHPSSLDMSHATPSRRHSLNRRSSGYSPMTPRSSHEFDHGSPAHNAEGAGGNELGNLADELGDVWDDDEEGVEGEYGDDMDLPQDEVGSIGLALDHDGSAGQTLPNGVPRDSGVAMQSSSPESKATLSPNAAAKQNGGRRHQRTRSLYDGSDYGDESDFEVNEGISAGLEKQMAAVEGLVRRGMEDNGSSSDQAVKRFIERLRDLGSQTSIENGATRLKTTHDALASHLTHQSRTLTSLAASFSGPRAIIPDPDTIDELVPLISSTLETLPHSSPEAIHLITQLTFSNREMLEHLSNVSDSLHMSRQGQTNAARRLKTAKDQLADWKRDADLRDQGIQYIESGDWDRKLKERDAKRDCGSVLEGFEETCGMWRKRLCEGLGVASA